MLFSPATLGILILSILPVAVFLVLMVLVFRGLFQYIHAKDARTEKEAVKKSGGKPLKARRLQCKMTQEFVAEALGVSRQAVSKWEQGKSDPSTSNLLALAKLFHIPAEELLKDVE